MTKLTFLKRLKDLPRRQFYYLILATGFTLSSISVFYIETSRIMNYNRVIDHNVVGYQFLGITDFIKDGTKFVSYYTDGNLNSPNRYKLFQKAQYVFAPIILDPDSLDHEYVLFVTNNPVAALKIIKAKNLIPLQLNPKDGILLARKR